MRVCERGKKTPSPGVVVRLWAWRGVGTANLSRECESGCVGVCEETHRGLSGVSWGAVGFGLWGSR